MTDFDNEQAVADANRHIITTTINGIYEIDKNYLDVELIDDGMIITVLKTDKVGDALIKNMLTLLSELSDNYPENIKIKIK